MKIRPQRILPKLNEIWYNKINKMYYSKLYIKSDIIRFKFGDYKDINNMPNESNWLIQEFTNCRDDGEFMLIR